RISPLAVLAFGSVQITPTQSDETWQARLEKSWRQSPAGVLLFAKRNEQEKPPATNQAEKATARAKPDLPTMVQNGKFLYEMDKFDEAETIFKKVLQDDRSNRTAPYYLDLIKEARYMDRARQREKAAKSGLWAGLGDPPLQSMHGTNLIYTSKGRQRILTKLDSIIL